MQFAKFRLEGVMGRRSYAHICSAPHFAKPCCLWSLPRRDTGESELFQEIRTSNSETPRQVRMKSASKVSGTVQRMFQVIHADRSQNLGAVGESGVLKDLRMLIWRNAYSPRYHQATDVAWSDQATFPGNICCLVLGPTTARPPL